MYQGTLVRDFTCTECRDSFIDYPFEFELDESQVLSDDGIPYVSISCPSCGGGQEWIEIALPAGENK
jgi:hypothetical protein